ncbi:hypothetical protein TKK_0001278 [Trichogramma kaykai]
MDFIHRLLNKPSPKPAICSPTHQPSVESASESLPSSQTTTAPSSGPNSLVPETLSSASSFQSLDSKSSSGICADSAPGSPEKTIDNKQPLPRRPLTNFDQSYINVNDIPDIDDLISGCANIKLDSANGHKDYNDEDENADSLQNSSGDLSPDQTFASAADDTVHELTQVNGIQQQDEENVTNFKTCLNNFEPSTQTDEGVFKVPLPVQEDTSSLRKTVKFDPDDDAFKSANSSFHSHASPKRQQFVKTDGFLPSNSSPENGISDSSNSELSSETFNDTVLVSPLHAHRKASKVSNFTINKTSQIAPAATEYLSAASDLNSYQTAQNGSFHAALNPNEDIKDNLDASGVKESEFIDKEVLNFDHSRILDDEEEEVAENQNITKDIVINKTLDNIDDKNNLNVTKELVQKENDLNLTQDFVQKENSNYETVLVDSNYLSESDIYEDKTGYLLCNNQEDSSKGNASYIKEELTDAENVKGVIPSLHTPTKIVSPSNNQILHTPVPGNDLISADVPSINVIASTSLPIKGEVDTQPIHSPKIVNTQLNKSEEFSHQPDPASLTFVQTKTNVEKEGENFDKTIERSVANKDFEATQILPEKPTNTLPGPEQEQEYEAFKPQVQSTTLQFTNPCEIDPVKPSALNFPKNFEAIEETEHFVSATTDIFSDPSQFDFLNKVGSTTSTRGERYDSLYLKFDPLLSKRLSMLPQKNAMDSTAVNEDVKSETKQSVPAPDIGCTPTKALAAIDRLLFYSPSPPTTNSEAPKDIKKEEPEKPETQTVPVVDEKMAKELELVRNTVIQLEEELGKLKREHNQDLEKQKKLYEEQVNAVEYKFGQMQSQLSQEVKSKDQMTVIAEEYEKSISRLVAEREKDKATWEMEKARLTEELQAAQQHLMNTEAAFNDVHTKYERLKSVVSAYKSNEAVLKESIAENQETIKTLEDRYEQLKSHAVAQLDKANMELASIKAKNDADLMKLKALVRKAELKSKSLEETVEQKSKENKELTQIIDEMIARVD